MKKQSARRLSPSQSGRPTPEQIQAAKNSILPDVIANDLRVLFIGINPSLYSAAVGHHFGRPGNRFWPALFAAGLTDRLFQPHEDRKLLLAGCGVTNLVARATARADELSAEEIRQGADKLKRKIKRRRVQTAAFVGVTAYRTGFGRPHAKIGQQEEKCGGAMVWVLPNPSGLNAHYQAADFARLFSEFRQAVGLPDQRRDSG
ncbi:G/U mismatch-specific DNA glycosylase [Lignipirellula cremea]|uniref:G/U mismatch-specific DNA glycosylase n=1 Tax=Lignipirellula cremea TaxID=2528010 RepID=A0A518DTX5_9BACT|nr:G/U mismatch-specific DNA glycosylase [Lignipirellula cremea]QDU95284.1 G/U mismatch-specific DNA glycosylase [Lignipirellula cremea]